MMVADADTRPNAQLVGTIPAELGGMASLVAISLANNNLEGETGSSITAKGIR